MKPLKMLAVILFLPISGCGEEDLETADFNTFFQPVLGQKENIATVTGLQACRNRAELEGIRRHLASQSWSYECCKISFSSSCASVHQ